MNCKEGDLAYIAKTVRSDEAIGIVVTCLYLLPAGSDKWNVRRGPIWVIDKFVPVTMSLSGSTQVKSWPDADMFPIAGPSIGEVDQNMEDLPMHVRTGLYSSMEYP